MSLDFEKNILTKTFKEPFNVRNFEVFIGNLLNSFDVRNVAPTPMILKTFQNL